MKTNNPPPSFLNTTNKYLSARQAEVYYLLILLFLFPVISHSQTITVKQDGTGNFTTIQVAVDSAQHGDTVLVWPGTYVENVDFLGKNIILSSLILTTGDDNYKYKTIIDGNHSGSCVVLKSGENSAKLYGFTLQNGTGYKKYNSPEFRIGGGIAITNNSTVYSYENIIENCSARFGGGIDVEDFSSIHLIGTTICNNHAYENGGGIGIGYQSHIYFDTINLNSIYLNYAGWGCDLIKPEGSIYIKLDTCSVLNPNSYFFSSVDENGYEVNDFTFDIQHAKIIPSDTNLYVNPVTGNDSSSGLTPYEPLKTIAFAYSKILPDTNNVNTIYLANGIYSDTINGEKFPLNIRAYINITGGNSKSTILDGEYKSNLFKGNNEVCNYNFSKMTLRRGTLKYYGINFTDGTGLIKSYLQNDNITFDSIFFSEGWSNVGESSVFVLGSNNVHINNCKISNCIGDAAIRIANWDFLDTCYLTNCFILNSRPDTNLPSKITRGMATSNGITILINTLFNNNIYNAFISTFAPTRNYIINSTFTDNPLSSPDAVFWLNETRNYIYNTIVFKNGINNDKSFLLSNINHEDTTTLKISYSLIENGEQSAFFSPDCNNDCILLYDSSNIDADPLFYGGAEFPYNLSDNSPCIDAGTLDLPQFVLDNMPDVDLAGNPRIFNSKIDMGAYEWNPTVEVKENPATGNEQQATVITVAPNPFSTLTYISAKWDKQTDVNLAVYNNAGLLVNTLQSGRQLPGSCRLPWNGTGNTGNLLPAGVYLIVLTVDGKEKGSVKVVKR